eukprot:s2074_g7.t1
MTLGGRCSPCFEPKWVRHGAPGASIAPRIRRQRLHPISNVVCINSQIVFALLLGLQCQLKPQMLACCRAATAPTPRLHGHATP